MRLNLWGSFSSFLITSSYFLSLLEYDPPMPQQCMPKWFNSQCAKSCQTQKPPLYAMETSPNSAFKSCICTSSQPMLQNHQSWQNHRDIISMGKTSFVNHINNKIASCQTGSRSFWSLAKAVSQNFCHSSFPLLENNSGSSSCTPSSKANLFASTFRCGSRKNFDCLANGRGPQMTHAQ